MNQIEAENIFKEKVEQEAKDLYERMKTISSEGNSSLIYYPSSRPLLLNMKKKMKQDGFWTKNIQELNDWNYEQVKRQEDQGNFYYFKSYTNYKDSDRTKYFRQGLRIWWVKPGFWDKFNS